VRNLGQPPFPLARICLPGCLAPGHISPRYSNSRHNSFRHATVNRKNSSGLWRRHATVNRKNSSGLWRLKRAPQTVARTGEAWPGVAGVQTNPITCLKFVEWPIFGSVEWPIKH
jgi:hypothetical protein